MMMAGRWRQWTERAARCRRDDRRTAGRGRFGALTLAVVLAVSACSGGGSAAGGFSFSSPGGASEISYSGENRQPVPELSGPKLVGEGTIGLSDFADKVVVLNFWGSWCPPCRAEAEDLRRAALALEPDGVQFLGIDIRDTRQAGADFQASFKVPYPSIFDPSMRTLLALRGYPSNAIPSTIVLDRKHRVAQIWLRPVTEREVVAVVSLIAAEEN